MSEFGFSDTPIGREKDLFADLSENEFRSLLRLAKEVARMWGVVDKDEALLKAKEIRTIVDQSLPLERRKTRDPDSTHHKMERAILDREKPCSHRRYPSVGNCRPCEWESREKQLEIDKNRKFCNHAKIYLIEPCSECAQSDPHVELAKANAIIGVLLDRLGGAADLTPEETLTVKLAVGENLTPYKARLWKFEPITLKLTSTTGVGDSRFDSSTPRAKVATRNPSDPSPDSDAWLSAWGEDEEQLPF